MSKLEPHQENPLEVLCYKFAEKISPFFRSLNFTPNGLTTISNIGAIIALYGTYHKRAELIVVGFVIKYLFDCADGYYARRYKMTSKFGDVYDHGSDLIFVLGIVWILWTKFTFRAWAYPYRGYFIAGAILFVFMSWLHMGCQETLYSKKTGKTPTQTLKFSQDSCPNAERMVHFTKWVGSPVVPVLLGLGAILFVLC